MTELTDSLVETLEEIAGAADAALQAPWRDKDSLRDTLTRILCLSAHARVEAEDLRLLVDLES